MLPPPLPHRTEGPRHVIALVSHAAISRRDAETPVQYDTPQESHCDVRSVHDLRRCGEPPNRTSLGSYHYSHTCATTSRS